MSSIYGKQKQLPDERTRKQVYDAIMDGLSGEEIAAKLCITVKSVKWHKTSLYKQYKVKSVAQLIVLHYKALLAPYVQTPIQYGTATELKGDDLPLGLKL